jgi:NADH:ubiquinone oxidoreductase subunit F (NADH-binding)
MSHIILRHRDIENIHEIAVYRANGGYDGLKKALTEHKPDE